MSRFDELKARSVGVGNQPLQFVQIAAMSGGEIVEADHLPARAQKRLDEVRADEPGRTGDQPLALAPGQRCSNVFG